MLNRHNWIQQQGCSCLLFLALLVAPTDTLRAQPRPQININGASEALEANIRAHLRINEESCNSTQRRLNRLAPNVSRSIEAAMQALGYYQGEHSLTFTEQQTCWSLNIDVNEGQAVLVGDIQLNINSDSLLTEETFLRSSAITSGSALNHAHYENLKSQISSAAVENGYFDARFTRSEIAIDLERNIADIHIEFNSGPRYGFGAIDIAPVEGLSESFIRRFLNIEEGAPYSAGELALLRQNLNDSQYFTEVSVSPVLNATHLQASNRTVPVSVTLQTRPKQAWSIGLGATTDIGPRVTLAYENRYLNRKGHRLSSDISVSTVEQKPQLNYVIPLSDPSHDSLSFNIAYLGQRNESFDSDIYQIGSNYRSDVDLPWLGDGWLQNVFLNYQREDSTLNNISEKSNLTIGGLSWSVTRSDDPVFPSKGWRLFTQVSGASESFGSDLSFMQLYASAKIVTSIGEGRILARTEIATTLVDELQELPVSIRYFTGGDQSVRGYQYESLGALNEAGETIGGKHLATASIEYDFPIRNGWRLAVFHDAGNSFANFSTKNLKRSIGFGLRWRSPIGAIRADLASGIGDRSVRLHITMGPDL
ncbi:MAG: autotransporter assembly complex family protein [Pseudohongiellaceae bacterium]|nr:autotransporter assembly complex family protein [Pseudohongiellaceae bacterium]